MAKSKLVFVCKECGKESLRWMGQCPACSSWNSFAEQTVKATSSNQMSSSAPLSVPQELSRVEATTEERWPVDIAELSRVLGGGLVPGSLVLIGGEPGIGKSTLLLQVSSHLAATRGTVAYVSGEETLHQTRLRAKRLGISGERSISAGREQPRQHHRAPRPAQALPGNRGLHTVGFPART